jgi:hypothetical protein
MLIPRPTTLLVSSNVSMFFFTFMCTPNSVRMSLLLAQCPICKQEDDTSLFVHGCLFIIFTATFHSWRQSLYLQSEDVPCCDKPPTWYGKVLKTLKKIFIGKTEGRSSFLRPWI